MNFSLCRCSKATTNLMTRPGILSIFRSSLSGSASTRLGGTTVSPCGSSCTAANTVRFVNPYRRQSVFVGQFFVLSCSCAVADTVGFSGVSLIRWDLARHVVSATEESLRFRFRTNQANGVLLYSRGTQGDYFSMQLRENRMLLNVNLGRNNRNFLRRKRLNPLLEFAQILITSLEACHIFRN